VMFNGKNSPQLVLFCKSALLVCKSFVGTIYIYAYIFSACCPSYFGVICHGKKSPNSVSYAKVPYFCMRLVWDIYICMHIQCVLAI